MNAKELMNPRFEVIADYPSNPNAVGTILECPDFGEGSVKQWIEYFSRYPHLFKRLNWWEYRTTEQMPKKLICKAFGSNNGIIPIEEWDMDTLWGWRNKNDRIGCGLRDFLEFSYFPVD
jgi:hypothetical protein